MMASRAGTSKRLVIFSDDVVLVGFDCADFFMENILIFMRHF